MCYNSAMDKQTNIKAVVVLSGGQDSATCLALAVKKHGAGTVAAITFKYGQRHQIETKYARRLAKRFGVKRALALSWRGVRRALADAVEWACDSKRLNDMNNWYMRLFDYLCCGLKRANIDFSVIADAKPSTRAINAIRLNGLNADSLQQYCASKGCYIGVGGSACNTAGDFRVLNAYRLTNAEAAEVVRVSFGNETNKYDVDALVSAIAEYKQKYC